MTKVELFGRCVIWHKTNTAFYKKNIIPTVKHGGGGGSVMVRCCFAASGHGRLAIIYETMNSVLYQKILKDNVRPSVCDLKLTWVMQQDNDLKHTSKSTSEWLKKNNIKVLEVQTYIRMKFCGMTLNGPFMLQNSNVAELKQLQ